MPDGGASLYLALAATAVSTGVSIHSSNQRAKAQAAANEFNAETRRKQAKIAQEDAMENASRMRHNQAKELARIRAYYAGSGIEETGTALDMYGEQAGEFELEIADLYTNANRQAAGLENQARLDEFYGKQARTAGKFEMLGAAASGAGSATSFYLNNQPAT